MNTNVDALRRAKESACKEWERLDMEARAIQATLKTAKRRARGALRAFESARLAYLDARDEQERNG